MFFPSTTTINSSELHGSIDGTVIVSLLTAFVLIGLFAYLNRYTKRRYFSIWTVAWLFYALWLALSLNLMRTSELPAMQMFKQWAVGVAAMFLVWGSSRFLGKETRQTGMALFLIFLMTWSYTGAFVFGNSFVLQLPVFFMI